MSHGQILAFASASFSAVLAVVVALRERRSVASWSFFAGMIGFAGQSALVGMSLGAPSLERVAYWQNLALVVRAVLPGIWLCFSLTYSRGNYREFLRRWRSILAAAFVLPVLLLACAHGKLFQSTDVAVPGHDWWFAFGPLGTLLYFLLLVSAVLVLMNLERTFLTAVGTMRWRIKFMMLGLAVIFGAQIYTRSQALLFSGIDPALTVVETGALLVGCLLIAISYARSGLIEIDLYPSQTFLYRSVTVLLAGTYLVIIGVFAQVVAALGGAAAFTLQTFFVLVLLVLLAILLLSDRVRLHTRRFVSRHFQRPLHDYRTVWRSFTEGTASRADQTALCRATVKLVADIFQVLSVTIWLVDDKKEKLTFAASTSLSEAKGDNLQLQSADAAEVIRALRSHPDPTDIDASKENWAATLRQCHPGEFGTGGSRVCVPMIGAGDVLGVMTLGDRVGGVPFSLQDFDLLKCVGGQVAASLLNIQLSQKLLQAKELEAFQTMSAFFVHDLKNTASTLNLMLQNLPVHFDDPAFREDALRGISKTVDHINHLIARLSLFRHESKIQLVESDLNDVVSKALAAWEGTSPVDLVKDFRPLPHVSIDREQISKVVTNLVLNASEAVAGKGQVRIGTSQDDGWIVLAVADNGCGMSAEFLNRSLFRPFQSTKRNGLGVGMFQSKMIVEAHGGKIEVESTLGKGTAFRVLLPLQTPVR